MMMSAGQHGSSRLSQLLHGFANVEQSMDCDVNALFIDSRDAQQGGLFLACAGKQGHGFDYLSEAYDAGVAAVAWEPTDEYGSPPENVAHSAQVPLIAVKNLALLVGYIADRFYGHPSRELCVIGITGTDGKTSCCHFIAHALQTDGSPVGIIGTLGYGLLGHLQSATHTTPDAIRVHHLLKQMREQGARTVVMEVSSHGLDQGRVNGVTFEVAVLTHVSRDHLDYHGDEASYAKAKEQLFKMPGLRKAVINKDDTFGREWSQSLASDVQLITYGSYADASVSSMGLEFSDVSLTLAGMDWHVNGPWGSAHLHNQLFGRFNVYNLTAVLATLNVIGVAWDAACHAVEKLTNVPGRMEFYRSAGAAAAPQVVIDFAHTPDALMHVLNALQEHGFGKIWCVFGCGGDRDTGKRPLMGRAAALVASELILTDDNPRSESGEKIIADILKGITDQTHVHIERDRKAAIQWAIEHAGAGDVVLVAGKGDEEYQWVGDRKLPFSDRQVVQSLLQGGLH